MTRVFCVSGVAGAALLAAAVDTDLIGPGRRVLLVANESDTPEVAGDVRSVRGFDRLAARFDEVVSWNELIAPLHPSDWRPRPDELPVLGRLLASRLGLDDPPDEVAVESLVAGSGRTLVALLPDVAITVLGLDAAVLGPMLTEPATEVVERVTRLLHVDLLPGVHPHLLDHLDARTEAVPGPALLAALEPVRDPAAGGAVVLDERWAQRGVLTAEAELAVRLDAVRALVAAGHHDVVFAPHPAAAPADHTALIAGARTAGATLTVGPVGTPHEAWLGAGPVVGVAAPVLFLAPDAATVATRRLLDGLRRFDHADRVALVVANAALPHLDATGRVTPPSPTDLGWLLDALSFCLRPAVLPVLRGRAVRWVAEHGIRPYLTRRRLEALGLVRRGRSVRSIARALAHRARRRA